MSILIVRSRPRFMTRWKQRSAGPSPTVRPSPGNACRSHKTSRACRGVNKNTVLRALHTLRDEGLLEFTRGRGISVSGTPQKSAILGRVRDLVEFARHQGYRPVRTLST
jgi:hypothetical protein